VSQTWAGRVRNALYDFATVEDEARLLAERGNTYVPVVWPTQAISREVGASGELTAVRGAIIGELCSGTEFSSQPVCGMQDWHR
jgi:hypothetical protein